MKRFFSLFLMMFVSAYLFGQTQFQKVVGSTDNDRNYHLAAMSDGTLYATGYTMSVPGNGRDAFLVKYNSFGEVLWAKTYGDVGDETNWDVIVTQNNELVGAGHSSGLTPNVVGVLTRADSSGTVIWSIGVGHPLGNVNFYRVMETSTGELVAAGLTTISGSEDILICKFTPGGHLIWSRIVSTPQNDEIMGMTETAQGDYLFAGLTNDATGSGGTEFAAVKTDTAGNVIWRKRYGGPGNERLNTVVEHDNSYYFMGWSNQGGIGGNDVVVMRTDTAGDPLWLYSYGTPETERSFNMLYDPARDALMVAGYTDFSDSLTNNRNTFLMSLDTDGNMHWARSYGSTGTDGHWPTGLAMTGDEGYYLLGSTNTFGPGSYSLYLIKTDAEGFTACNQKDPMFVRDTISGWTTQTFGQTSTGTMQAMPAVVAGVPWSVTSSTLCCALYAYGGPDMDVCDGSSVQIGSSNIPGYEYTWHYQGTPAGTGAFWQVPSSEAGIWTLTAEASGSGCNPAHDTVVVSMLTSPPPVTISYLYTPGNYLVSSATDGNQWYRDGLLLPGETDQQIHATITGVYHVVVTNSYGCQAVSDTLHHVFISVENIGEDHSFKLYPNPATDMFSLQFNKDYDKVLVEVIDSPGRQIHHQLLGNVFAGGDYQFETNRWRSGIYTVVVTTVDQRITMPLVIIR